MAVCFENLGPYHVARLEAVQQALAGELTVLQTFEATSEYPWGRAAETCFQMWTLSDRPNRDPLLSLRLAKRMRKALDGLRPDVVAVAGWNRPEMRAALHWGRRAEIPVILMSETRASDRARRRWKEVAKRKLYVNRYAGALVGGTAHVLYLEQLRMERARIHLGYDVVDNPYFARSAAIARSDHRAARQRNRAIPSVPYFFASSRFIARKNLAGLIAAYAGYRSVMGENSWDLVVAGSGRDERLIRQVINELGLQDHVHLPGFVPYEHLGDWYGLASAFVHPALSEPWGLVINEACAASLPILCSSTTGACHDLVREGQNGFVFDPTSIADMREALEEMHRLPEQDRERMGRRSRQIVADYGPERFAEGFMEAITAAASN